MLIYVYVCLHHGKGLPGITLTIITERLPQNVRANFMAMKLYMARGFRNDLTVLKNYRSMN